MNKCDFIGQIADNKNNILVFKNWYYCEKNNNVISLTMNLVFNYIYICFLNGNNNLEPINCITIVRLWKSLKKK